MYQSKILNWFSVKNLAGGRGWKNRSPVATILRRQNIPKQPGIYGIQIDKQIYVGSSIDLYQRLYNQCCDLRKGKSCRALQLAYNNRKGALRFSIIDLVPIEQLKRCEMAAIETFGTLNLMIGRDGNWRTTEEGNRKRKEWWANRTAEQKEAYKKQLAKQWRTGIRDRDRVAELVRKAKNKYWAIPGNREKMSATLKGKPKSEKHKHAISKAMKGIRLSKTHNVNILKATS